MQFKLWLFAFMVSSIMAAPIAVPAGELLLYSVQVAIQLTDIGLVEREALPVAGIVEPVDMKRDPQHRTTGGGPFKREAEPQHRTTGGGPIKREAEPQHRTTGGGPIKREAEPQHRTTGGGGIKREAEPQHRTTGGGPFKREADQ